MVILKKYKVGQQIIIALILGLSQLFAQNNSHPRLYCKNKEKVDYIESFNKVEWKKQIIEKKKAKVDKYIELCNENSDWLVSRLQMNWKTKHSKVFLDGIKFSHSSGEAPVATVRFSGGRDWDTDYSFPPLEEIEPYFDDVRGMYLKNKNTDKMEWVHPSLVGHGIEGTNRKIMSLVSDAAFLYWLTEEKKYAEFGENIFFTYIDGMYHRDAPIDLTNSNQQRISGLSTFEVIHDQMIIHLALTYDFLHSYFEAKNRDLTNTISVFQKWADQIIINGIPDNNWNLFQARFITHIALVLEENAEYTNGKGREYYLERVFEISSERQVAIKEAVLNYNQETGIWPESPSYSLHTTQSFLQILTLLDGFTNKNELANYEIIEKSVLASFQYLFPNGKTLAFGDSRHDIIPPENFELLISNYKKYQQKDKELMLTSLLNQLIEKGDYKRKGKDLFQLFFYVDSLESTNSEYVKESSKKLMWPTFYSPNVSLFIQRMGEGDEAMMVSTVGSFGNHSHVNGIAIELFANNYVLAQDVGKGSSYWSPNYREYYSQFPAHNTVAVDGQSTYGRMRGYHPFTLDNYFPEIGESTTNFDKVTFSKVSFVEPKTLSDQQRLTAQIKSVSGKGYIVDIFRSKKKVVAKQKHEYFYHNYGQSLEILDSNNNLMKLIPTDELGTLHGDIKAYDYLTDKQIVTTDKSIKALFTLSSKDGPNNFMKMWINESEGQKVFSVKSPKSDAIRKDSESLEVFGKKIPTVILRRESEAWSNPFAVVFNPFLENGINPILDVKFSSLLDNPETQKIEVHHTDKITKDIFVINASENDIATEKKFYLKGLVSIVRTLDSSKIPEFVFLSGVYKYQYEGWEIMTKQKAVTVSMERCAEGFRIENDQPIVIKVPIMEGIVFNKLEIYENDKVVSQKTGFVSRSNPNQIEFFLPKAYEKVVLISSNKLIFNK